MLRAFANVSVYYSVDKACCLFYYVGELLVEYICLDGMISYSDKIASTNPVSASSRTVPYYEVAYTIMSIVFYNTRDQTNQVSLVCL